MFTYHLSKIESETKPVVLLFRLMCLNFNLKISCHDHQTFYARTLRHTPRIQTQTPNPKPREVPKPQTPMPKPQTPNCKPQPANPNLQTPTSKAQPFTLNLKDQLISSHPVTFRHSEQPPPLALRLIYTVMVNRSCTLIDEVIDWCCRCQCISPPPPRTSIIFAFYMRRHVYGC